MANEDMLRGLLTWQCGSGGRWSCVGGCCFPVYCHQPPSDLESNLELHWIGLNNLSTSGLRSSFLQNSPSGTPVVLFSALSYDSMYSILSRFLLRQLRLIAHYKCWKFTKPHFSSLGISLVKPRHYKHKNASSASLRREKWSFLL